MQENLNAFDYGAVILLLIGAIQGGRRGFSQEILNLLKWLAIVALGAHGCAILGVALADWLSITPASGYVLAYTLIALLLGLAFYMLRRAVGGKLMSKDVFGRFEIPLGVTAGVMRLACIILVFMALLNLVPPPMADAAGGAPAAATTTRQFLGVLHDTVFVESWSGQNIKNSFSDELVQPPANSNPQPKRFEDIGRRRERAAEEALEGSKKK
jgi:uncharacterized membrane protein required for colicin V production